MAEPVIRRGRARRWIGAFLWLLVALVLAVVIGAYAFMRASLPTLDGEVAAAGLRGPVTVRRDALGVPTIHGSDRGDLAYATGYVHAQERFFQMDLLRRAGSGELAGLLGKALLPVDRERRIHRFGARAGVALAALPEPERVVLERYAAGVNAGLGALGARPFEYGVLRAVPRRWVAQDTLLVVWAMYFDLQDDQLHRVFARGWLRDQGSSPEQLAFLLPTASGYDAPLDAATIDEPAAPLPAEAPAWFGKPAKTKVALLEDIGNAEAGSNNWVVAGSRSKTGAAIVANDMHLALRLPHIWYRAAIELETPGEPLRRLVGVTLPGTPAVVAGSNGQVAWGLTNTYGAYVDLLELELDPKDATRYRLPPPLSGVAGDEWGLIRTVDERVAVAGGADEVLHVQETAFGPVWERGGRRYAVHWVAHDPGAVNFTSFGLERAAGVTEALAIGQRAGFPAQNLVAGDAAGHIGWTVAGALPNRAATWASTFPAPAASAASHTWSGLAPPSAHPSIGDPASGQIATANARQLAGAGYAAIGDGGADLGARQRQLRDGVTALGASTDEAGLYSVFLDDRALYLAPWRDRALQALAGDADPATRARRDEFKRLLETTWTGHASIDSVGYRLTRAFVAGLYARLFGGVDEAMKEADKQASFARATPRWPAVIARLLDEKPAGWLPQGSADWRAVQLAAIDDAIASIEKDGTPLAEATWGKRNTNRIVHPMAAALPLGARWLAAPAEPMPGDSHMPRVAAPDFGQSERFAVSPGREASGVFNMPGGQSGHPLSRNFQGGHADWVAGRATPLLPGPPVGTLRFEPR
jgi:penicillin G amidase